MTFNQNDSPNFPVFHGDITDSNYKVVTATGTIVEGQEIRFDWKPDGNDWFIPKESFYLIKASLKNGNNEIDMASPEITFCMNPGSGLFSRQIHEIENTLVSQTKSPQREEAILLRKNYSKTYLEGGAGTSQWLDSYASRQARTKVNPIANQGTNFKDKGIKEVKYNHMPILYPTINHEIVYHPFSLPSFNTSTNYPPGLNHSLTGIIDPNWKTNMVETRITTGIKTGYGVAKTQGDGNNAGVGIYQYGNSNTDTIAKKLHGFFRLEITSVELYCKYVSGMPSPNNKVVMKLNNSVLKMYPLNPSLHQSFSQRLNKRVYRITMFNQTRTKSNESGYCIYDLTGDKAAKQQKSLRSFYFKLGDKNIPLGLPEEIANNADYLEYSKVFRKTLDCNLNTSSETGNCSDTIATFTGAPYFSYSLIHQNDLKDTELQINLTFEGVSAEIGLMNNYVLEEYLQYIILDYEADGNVSVHLEY